MAQSYLDLPVVASSAGSVTLSGGVAITGSLSIAGTDRFSVRAVEQHLILSSSAGSQVTVSGAMVVKGGNMALDSSNTVSAGGFVINDNNNPSMYFGNRGSFGLSDASSISWANAANAGIAANLVTKVRQRNTGSVAFSGANAGGGVTLSSESGHLILSSSLGSSIYVSGALTGSEEILVGASMRLGSLNTVNGGGSIGGSGNNVFVRTHGTVSGFAGNSFAVQDTNGNVNPYISAGGFGTNRTGLIGWSGGTGVGTADTVLNRTNTGSLGISGSDGTAMVVARSGHLVLSSSVGSIVAVSGTLRYGTHVALGSETVQGYIIIQDKDGVERKLAVVTDAG